MEKVNLMFLLVLQLIILSCSQYSLFNLNPVHTLDNNDVNENYKEVDITDKTLLIATIEKDSIALLITEGLDDNVRYGKSKNLFLVRIEKKLAKSIIANSTFKTVKYQTDQDTMEYNFTLNIQFIATKHEVDFANVEYGAPDTGGPQYSPGNEDKNLVLLFCTYNIVDNSNNEIVVTGEIGNFKEIKDFQETEKKKKKHSVEDYFSKNRVSLQRWNKAVSTLGKKLMKDTPFSNKAEYW